MSTQRTVFGIVAFALAALIGLRFGFAGASPTADAPTESTARTSALQARVATLENEVSLLRGELRASVDVLEAAMESKRSADGAATDADRPFARSMEDFPAESPASVLDSTEPSPIRVEDADMAVGLEEVLASEALDDAWAGPREEEFFDFFAASEARDTELLDARCQSTLCRVEVEHESGEAVEAFLLEGLMDAAFAGRQLFFHHEMQPDGGIRTELFVARQGSKLPAINRGGDI